jgi:hypothetical protein
MFSLLNIIGKLDVTSSTTLSTQALIYSLCPFISYSLRIAIRICLGQRHGLQSATLASIFYKKYWLESYICIILYENNFKDKSIDMFSYFQTQQLKSYSRFIVAMFDPNIVQNVL